jgi:2-dehydro-3-deoxyphosphooctonate aldolase (KDO 8-P synthase)
MISTIPNIKHASENNFFLIAGPCVVEEEALTRSIAEQISALCESYKIPFIFKASFRKANRTRMDSFSGIGDTEALTILKKIRRDYKLPVVTDIHESNEAAEAAEVVDVLQIPAFLCRQTELLIAAGKTGKHVNIKKGQFVSAESMKFAVDKIKSTGNKNILLTERGTMLGYNDLVVDFRNISVMKSLGVPVVLDVTHSLQQPNQSSGVTGGRPQLIETIAKAGIAAGVDGIFLETHPEPAKAKSDGANMLKLDLLKELLEKLLKVREAIQ